MKKGRQCITKQLNEPTDPMISLPITILGEDCKLGLTDRSSVCKNVGKYLETMYSDCRPEKPDGVSKEQRLGKRCKKYDKKLTELLGWAVKTLPALLSLYYFHPSTQISDRAEWLKLELN